MDVTLETFTARAGELARRAQAGEVVTIVDQGVAVAQLGPLRRAVRFSRSADALRSFAALPPLNADQLRADVDAVLSPHGRNADGHEV